MQILEPPSEIHTYYDQEQKVHVIENFGISTKPNEALWRISRKTGHEKVKSFLGKDFAIIPELINAPLSQGGGGHYFGADTRDDILSGYAKHSHGKISKIKGPYYYNDGTDDYWYDFQTTLSGSKAASALIQYGENTWVKYSVSPHIWPHAGTDDNITDWEGLGVALVIKGAYGPQAVVTKLCKGTAVACNKSLGASLHDRTLARQMGIDPDKLFSPTLCEKEDAEIAQIISSLVSKSASTPVYMTENKEASPPSTTTPQVNPVAQVEIPQPQPKQNTTVDTQLAVSNAPKIVTAEEFAASEKEKQELKKQVTQLLNDKKNNELTSILIDFAGTSDEKRKKDFVEKWFKKEGVDVNVLREFYNDIKTEIAERRKKASEQGEEEEKPEDDDKEKPLKAKSKSGSVLPKEPVLPKGDISRVASTPVNKAKEIAEFIFGRQS